MKCPNRHSRMRMQASLSRRSAKVHGEKPAVHNQRKKINNLTGMANFDTDLGPFKTIEGQKSSWRVEIHAIVLLLLRFLGYKIIVPIHCSGITTHSMAEFWKTCCTSIEFKDIMCPFRVGQIHGAKVPNHENDHHQYLRVDEKYWWGTLGKEIYSEKTIMWYHVARHFWSFHPY